MAGQQPLDVAVADAAERFNEVGDIAAVVRVDGSHATVAINIVAGKKQLAQAKRQLTVRVARRMPDLQFDIAHLDLVPFLDQHIQLEGGHFQVDPLRLDLGKGHQPISGGERLGGQGVAGDRGFQRFFCSRHPLHVVRIRMRGDQGLAFGKGEVELSDQLDDLLHRFLKTDVNQ